MFPSTVVGIHSQYASASHWDGGLQWIAFLRPGSAGTGHDVRLLPAQYVKPYVKTKKSDYIGVEAIAEAGERPSMRCVPITQVGTLLEGCPRPDRR
jgi:hypothetical protein